MELLFAVVFREAGQVQAVTLQSLLRNTKSSKFGVKALFNPLSNDEWLRVSFL